MYANAVSTKSARRVALALVGAVALLLAAMSGSAVAKDRNHDKIPDRWEKRHGLSLKVEPGQAGPGLRRHAEPWRVPGRHRSAGSGHRR